MFNIQRLWQKDVPTVQTSRNAVKLWQNSLKSQQVKLHWNANHTQNTQVQRLEHTLLPCAAPSLMQERCCRILMLSAKKKKKKNKTKPSVLTSLQEESWSITANFSRNFTLFPKAGSIFSQVCWKHPMVPAECKPGTEIALLLHYRWSLFRNKSRQTT